MVQERSGAMPHLGRPLLCLLLILLATGAFYMFSGYGLDLASRRLQKCEVSPETRAELVTMAHAVSSALSGLHVEHALCYGSLWGALRYGALLPWATHVHFCALGKEIDKVRTSSLREHLAPHGLDISYSFRHGQYHVTKRKPSILDLPPRPKSPDPELFITVFDATSSGETRTRGLDPWLTSLFHPRPTVASFPTRLLQGPLKTLPFHGEQLPVPNSDGEIMKFWYPDDWWREVVYADCQQGSEPA